MVIFIEKANLQLNKFIFWKKQNFKIKLKFFTVGIFCTACAGETSLGSKKSLSGFVV